jgi:hypothetical protein
LEDATPKPADPITLAAAASTGFTPQMHGEAYDRLIAQINNSDQRYRMTDPGILDLCETALYHAAHSERPQEVYELYDRRLGGYQHLGWRLGDYRRGLRITALLMQTLGSDYMDVRNSPAHDHNLFLIALGQPRLAEENTRHLLQRGRELVLAPEDANLQDRSLNPFSFYQREPDRGFAFYEGVLLQTLCDALLAQGKLRDAEAVMNEVLSEPHEWRVGGNDERRNGSNPHGRRAVARALSGDVVGALADFKAADTFAAEHCIFTLFPSRDWHHRIYHAALLVRLGYLTGAQRRLERMNIDRIRACRPWTAAEFDLTSAEIAYARLSMDAASEHANRALAWATESGHQSVCLRAQLLTAKVNLRNGLLDKAGELLDSVETAAQESGYALQHVDCLILKGYLALANGDISRARTVANEAESSSESLPYRWGTGDARHILARCAEIEGKRDEAQHFSRQALFVRGWLKDPKANHTNALMERLWRKPSGLQ